MSSRSSRSRRTAFTLLELLAVATILGVIAAIIVSRFSATADLAKMKANAHNKASINSLVEQYYLETGSWPSTTLAEMDHTKYFPDGIPVSPYDGTAYTIDATTHRVNNNDDP